MLEVHDLSTAVRSQVECYNLDLLDAEHTLVLWEQVLPNATFMRLRGYLVLLPFPDEHRPLITVEYLFSETHRPVITFMLLKSQPQDGKTEQGHDRLTTQYLVVASHVQEQKFFITTIFHRLKC